MDLETALANCVNQRVFLSYGDADTGYDPCKEVVQGVIRVKQNRYVLQTVCTTRKHNRIDKDRIVLIRQSIGKNLVYKHPRYYQDRFNVRTKMVEFELYRNNQLEASFDTKGALSLHLKKYSKQVV